MTRSGTVARGASARLQPPGAVRRLDCSHAKPAGIGRQQVAYTSNVKWAEVIAVAGVLLGAIGTAAAVLALPRSKMRHALLTIFAVVVLACLAWVASTAPDTGTSAVSSDQSASSAQVGPDKAEELDQTRLTNTASAAEREQGSGDHEPPFSSSSATPQGQSTTGTNEQPSPLSASTAAAPATGDLERKRTTAPLPSKVFEYRGNTPSPEVAPANELQKRAPTPVPLPSKVFDSRVQTDRQFAPYIGDASLGFFRVRISDCRVVGRELTCTLTATNHGALADLNLWCANRGPYDWSYVRIAGVDYGPFNFRLIYDPSRGERVATGSPSAGWTCGGLTRFAPGRTGQFEISVQSVPAQVTVVDRIVLLSGVVSYSAEGSTRRGGTLTFGPLSLKP